MGTMVKQSYSSATSMSPGREAGHSVGDAAGLGGTELGQARCAHQVLVRVVLADALQVDGLRLEVARPLGRGDDERPAGIRDEAAVQHAERIGDRL